MRTLRGRWHMLAPLLLLAQTARAEEAPEQDTDELERVAPGTPEDQDPAQATPEESPEQEEHPDPTAAEQRRAEEIEVPVGRATDTRGDPLVALHFQSPEEGLRLFLGPPSFEPDEYGLALHRLPLDASDLREICRAPCERWVYPGEYTLGLAPARVPDEEGARRAVRARDHLWLDGPAVVTGKYHSYAWLRAVGWATMGAGLATSSVLILVAFDQCDGEGRCLQGKPMAWLGAGAFFVGVSGGLLLTLKGDEVSFSVTPAVGLPDPD